MPDVLSVGVTGASGFLGRHVIRELARQPHVRVLALARRDLTAPLRAMDNVSWVHGSVEEPEALQQLMTRRGVLLNLAHRTTWTAEDSISACRAVASAALAAGVRRIVHCSTAVVVGSAPERRIDEDTPCRPKTPYERTKWLTELSLAAATRGALELCIARPSAIVGVGGQNLLGLIKALLTGRPAVNYARACLMGRRSMNLVCVENVTAALVFLATRPQAADQETYFVSDDDDPANNFRDVERALRTHLQLPDCRVPMLPVPPAVLAAALRIRGRSATDPLRVYDASRLSRAGYRRAIPLAEGLKRLAEAIRSGEAALG
jgi:nucleoside-diphosphate-sugar epimerase